MTAATSFDRDLAEHMADTHWYIGGWVGRPRDDQHDPECPGCMIGRLIAENDRLASLVAQAVRP